MTLAALKRCSSLSAELDEPMIGTVEQRVRWLLIEDYGAWGSHAVADVLGSDVAAAAKARGVRPLLVRPVTGRRGPPGPARAILVDTATREMAVRSLTGVEDLAAIGPIASAPVSVFGSPLTGPIFLVCTNGKRDACCALRGRALIGSLAATQPEQTFECTHLGGHRFAAHLVCLPHGIVYGRVLPSDGPRLADAYLNGRLDPALLRGRSAWPAPAQVAAQALLVRHGLSGVDDLHLRSAEITASHAVVTFRTADGAEHEVALRSERSSPPRPITCRAEDLDEPLHWRVID